jgi:DNA-binding NtrC family response regulator
MAEIAVETVRLLVVSREMALVRLLWSIGESNSWHLETAATGWEAIERLQSGVAPNLCLLDLPRGGSDSLHVLGWLRRVRPDLPVVAVCHSEDGAQKEAARLGAQEVLVRPFGEGRLEGVIRRCLRPNRNAEAWEPSGDDVESAGDDEYFPGGSPAMQKLRAQAELLAQADVPALILGEPGTGKGRVARLIHRLSARSGFAFQSVNCATTPGDLLEIELFGGTSSRSVSPARGSVPRSKLELAKNGTLLLKEITEMPQNAQSNLLQVLQEKQFERMGEAKRDWTDTRILATSSVEPDRALADRRLRDDLYRSLSGFTITVPPLRHRKEEIKVHLQHFMHKLAREYGLATRDFTPAAMDACVSHSWPGNLRELEAFVKRYLVAGDKGFSPSGQPAKLASRVEGARFSNPPGRVNRETEADCAGAESRSLKSLVRDVTSEAEQNAISAALEKTGWNRKAAARLLKVSYRTLLYKIEHYRMNSSEPSIARFAEARLFVVGGEAKGNGKAS